MPGRQLLSEDDFRLARFATPECRRRRQVLRETLAAFDQSVPPGHYHQLAADNLARWQREAPPPGALQLAVMPGDWGEVTAAMTARHGRCFAVLNMANAEVAGGAYVEGAVAQEENMFRRSDCHFRVDAASFNRTRDRYHPPMTDLLNALAGRVYLDTQ